MLNKARIVGALSTPYIIAGEDVSLYVQLSDKYTLAPMILSGVDEAQLILLNADGTQLVKTLGDGVNVIDVGAGIASVDINDTESALLKTGPELDLEFSVTIDGETTIVQFEDFEVKPSLF